MTVSLTSSSLLERLRDAPPDAADWTRLHDIYSPLIRSWLRRVPGLGDEADDLAQEVLTAVVRELPAFERRRDGAFRAWLRQITLNRIRAFHKARRMRPLAGAGEALDRLLAQLEDPASNPARHWDRDHDKHVLQGLLALVQADFEPATWQAFTRFTLQGLPASQVARELGTSEAGVFRAKFRVLKRLREEAGELLD
jgi:RNA polymerase sigma-70 factor (ECF subfamily)